MQDTSNLYFLQNNEIDKQKWDECVTAAANGLIYARSFYLDNMCHGWKALTGKNYEWVLPISQRTKFGISYLYQPPFTQQLGVFAKPGVIVPLREIIHWLKTNYKFWEVNWNYTTDTSLINPPVNITVATNYILDLARDYESITTNYGKDLINNIRRSRRFKLIYRGTSDYNRCIELFKKYYGNRLINLKDKDYNNFGKLCDSAFKRDMLIAREAVDNKGELMSIVLLLNDGKRIYNVMNTTTDTGRKTGANHFLLDSVIREFSAKDLLFDFEGSDLPGVKSFYENFGPVSQPYFRLKYNNLRWPVRLFKN